MDERVLHYFHMSKCLIHRRPTHQWSENDCPTEDDCLTQDSVKQPEAGIRLYTQQLVTQHVVLKLAGPSEISLILCHDLMNCLCNNAMRLAVNSCKWWICERMWKRVHHPECLRILKFPCVILWIQFPQNVSQSFSLPYLLRPLKAVQLCCICLGCVTWCCKYH